MESFESFLSEGKKLQIKRKYTENHPAHTVGKTANVRNAVLKAVADGVITEDEFVKILSELSGDHKQWRTRNKKYFFVSEEGIKLSKWGMRILNELDSDEEEMILSDEISENFKVLKDKWPYIEVKSKGKKYEIEFDDYDVIDDHGNEGKDLYFMGTDQNGDMWEIDVYADYRDEVQDIHYDTLVQVDESASKKVEENIKTNMKKENINEAKELSVGDKGVDYNDNVVEVIAIGKYRQIAKMFKKEMKADAEDYGFEETVKGDYYLAKNIESEEGNVGEFAIYPVKYDFGMYWGLDPLKESFNLFESFGDFLNSKGILNEKINSAILRSVLSNGKEGRFGKKNLANMAAGFYGLSKVALDKIQDEDFIISNDVSKIFKNYGGSSHVLFFISDNEKENPYYSDRSSGWNDYLMVPGGGIVLAAMSGDRQFYRNEWSRWAGGRSWSKDKKGDEGQVGINHKYRGWGASGLSNGKRIAEVSDRVIVINLELIRQKYSTEQLRAARKAAKAGATAFKSDKEFKAANLDRYHKILANKAASLPLDKMVKDGIDMLAKQLSDGLSKGEMTKYDEIKVGENPKGHEVKARDVSSFMSGILDDYARYVSYIKQGEESEARYGQIETYYQKESKNYAKRIKDKLAKIEKFDYAW